MTCTYCNAEIEDGSLYCNRCGKAVQMVPDYNVLEDDVLPAIINGKVKGDAEIKEPVESEEVKPGLFGTKSARRVAVFFILIFAVLVLGFAGIYGYTHSYGFLIQKGRGELNAGNYDRAIGYFRSAMEATEDPGESYILVAEAQIAAGYNDEAQKTLLSLLEDDPENLIAFTMLTDIYVSGDDIDGLDELSRMAQSDEQRQLIDENIIAAPEFSMPGGEYTDDVELFITAADDCEVYYTTDGTEPGRYNGIHYDGEPLLLSVGSTNVTAVCVRADGKAGRVASETYTIIYEAPKLPMVSPSGGRLTKVTFVTISTDTNEAELYYTWDGTVPTAGSSHYTGPIQVPEGNSILSVIAIDKHGLISPVLQVNYIYLP